jgi:hypothetical protein
VQLILQEFTSFIGIVKGSPPRLAYPKPTIYLNLPELLVLLCFGPRKKKAAGNRRQ